jgi:hypothetical protein
MRAEFKFVDVIISYVIYFMSNSTSCNNNSFSSNYILFVFDSILMKRCSASGKYLKISKA